MTRVTQISITVDLPAEAPPCCCGGPEDPEDPCSPGWYIYLCMPDVPFDPEDPHAHWEAGFDTWACLCTHGSGACRTLPPSISADDFLAIGGEIYDAVYVRCAEPYDILSVNTPLSCPYTGPPIWPSP